MKKLVFFGLVFLGLGLGEAAAQNYNNWAVGVKVGEPLGLNIRKYFGDGTKNFDVNVGSYGLLWGTKRNYRNDRYYEQAGVMVQGIFHFNNQIGSSQRMQVYYGFGGQVNQRRRPALEVNNVGEKHISLGGVVNSGLEYSLPSNGLGIFGEVGGYVEVAPKPFFVAANINVGVRMNLGK